MDVQRWILKRVLVGAPAHSSSYAYRSGRSILGCAECHIGARWLVKLDLHDFFHSIREHMVFPVFSNRGYTRLLSLEMTRVCTRAGVTAPRDRYFARYGSGTPYPVAEQGRLPQGAPTSGAIANAVMGAADAEIQRIAEDRGLIYTRYSDDLTFSTSEDLGRSAGAETVKEVAGIVERYGFAVHWKKARVIPPGARHIVLGLLVLDDRVLLTPEFKRRIEVHVRGVEKFGLPDHAAHRHFRSVLSMINHVDGCIAFARSVEPGFAAQMEEAWSVSLRNRGFPLQKAP